MSTKNRVFKSVFPGKYIQGEGVMGELPEIMRSFGERKMILSSRTVKNTLFSEYLDIYNADGIMVEEFNGECTEKEIERLCKLVASNEIDVLAGTGGGKVIDTAKIVADMTNIPVIIVPTIASTDAPVSGCGVIYSETGVFKSVYYLKMNPQVVIVDVRVIANAPVRFLVSGMGDALSTWFEARSCERTQSMNACDGYSTQAGLSLAKLCYDTLLTYGSMAKMACENKLITPALHRIVEANTLLSGIGFESSGLATAHAVHNGLSALPETHDYFHGEKVAFGVLTGLHLTDASPAEMETVYKFCEEVALPTTLKELGVVNLNTENLMKVAVKACEPQESIHHEAGEITPEKVLFAMMAADKMGNYRKYHG